jgi:tetratricopeptide (TPR) repeat protein
MVAAVRGWVAAIELHANAPREAEAVLRPAVETLTARGETGNLSTVAAYLAQALYAQGRLDEAEQATETSEQSAAADDIHAQVAWRVNRSRVKASRGALEQAETLAREAVALAAETDYLNLQGEALAGLGEVALAAGRGDAGQMLTRALEAYSAKGNVVAAAGVRETLERVSAAASVD